MLGRKQALRGRLRGRGHSLPHAHYPRCALSWCPHFSCWRRSCASSLQFQLRNGHLGRWGEWSDVPCEHHLSFGSSFDGNHLCTAPGAPMSPALAGAAAGLLAGALGATVFAMHCTNDWPVFVAIWYALAIGLISMSGLLIGRHALRW